MLRLALGLGLSTSALAPGTPGNNPAPEATPSNTRANSTDVRANNSNFAAALRNIEQQLTTLGA